MRDNFNNLLYTDPDDGWKITTEEGVAAVDEAIAYLQAATPLKRVTWNQYLGFACKDMVLSQGAAGLVGSRDASGQTLEAIYKAKYGTHTTTAGQSLNYGARPTATTKNGVTSTAGEKIVLQLLIDDSAATIKTRVNRENIFAAGFRVMGAFTGYNTHTTKTS
jgi:hypothetical protein